MEYWVFKGYNPYLNFMFVPPSADQFPNIAVSQKPIFPIFQHSSIPIRAQPLIV